MNKAVFLDRDGTINVEKNYLYKIKDFEFINGAPEAIKILNDNKYKVIVITNQAGVARGYYTENDIKILHSYIQSQLRKYNAHIDAFYYCPHHPTAGIGEYRIDCECRKPKNGLFKKAIKDFNIDVHESFALGDKVSDLKPALELGIKSILLKTGYGIREKNYIHNFDVLLKEDILDAVNYICEKTT
ncbi:D-glycero-beta-D-manno-heptose 1,7-bisphosphate 7-phosphatase [Clostridium fermenticellae]|uniref:D,D-heptose 1,7-bisphosphate phosphatase n=1 Tax=Clostridium fermenticellae TaxID=2068654 RepID=A0A386H6U1_9CLOT|nr:D-glycero-beta-D-manno-heptose 1,7-bisphosphate 7-phosphatase [Clostridium fermenticellae]AYD41396.1 D-glycero-beta-D-manno-heptose 1,7-bisphosphate 7-phosphatase [Clostridium fermenticellae]